MSSTGNNPFERDPFAGEHNPFAAPQSMDYAGEGTGQPKLATLSARFAGAFLDGLIMAPVTAGLSLGYVYGVRGGVEIGFGEETAMGAIVGVIAMIWFLIVNGYLLANRGQTVGKLVVKTRIVDVNTGELVPFWPLFLKRWLSIQLISFIPFAGVWIAFVGILLIFRSSRRCLHDEIAGTKVIAVQ